MQINPINNNQKNANFKAKMQLKGCTNLLKNEQIKSLENTIEKFGSKTDIVDINLSEKLIKKGFIPVAIFANNTLEQFIGEFKNSDIYSGIMNAFDKAQNLFPALAIITTVTTAVAVEDKKEEIMSKETKSLETVNRKPKENTVKPKTDDKKPNTVATDSLATENDIKKEINKFILACDDNTKQYKFNSENFPALKIIRNFIKTDRDYKNYYVSEMEQCTARYVNGQGVLYKQFTGDDEIDKAAENWDDVSAGVIFHMMSFIGFKEDLINLSSQDLMQYATETSSKTSSETSYDNDLYDDIQIKKDIEEVYASLVAVTDKAKVADKTKSIETNKSEKLEEITTIALTKEIFGTDKYEIINKEIDKFINSFRFYANDNPIEFILKNSIRNDSELYDEYTKRIQEKKYSYYDPWQGEHLKDNYTGYEIEDARKSLKWKEDSIEIIYRMLSEANLKEKITLASLNFLNENQLLENFDMAQLEDTCTMLNEKFKDWLELCKREYKNDKEYYEIKTHPVPVCIWNTVTSSDSELSKYLTKEFNSYNYSNEKDKDLRKAYIIEDLLKREEDCFWKEQLFSQLILNYPGKIPADEHKDLLDKISQSTVEPRVVSKQLNEEEMRKRDEAAQKTLWRILDSV